MKPSFYVASRLDQAVRAQAVIKAMQNQKSVCNFDWTEAPAVRPGQARERACTEILAVTKSDVVIVLFPAGRGSHVELGAALGSGVPVLIWAESEDVLNDPYLCVFHHYPGVNVMLGEFEVGKIVFKAMELAGHQKGVSEEEAEISAAHDKLNKARITKWHPPVEQGGCYLPDLTLPDRIQLLVEREAETKAALEAANEKAESLSKENDAIKAASKMVRRSQKELLIYRDAINAMLEAQRVTITVEMRRVGE